MIAVDNLTVVYGGKVRAVDRVSFGIAPGETLGLVGESGCGKTSLGKALLGLVPYGAGSIRIEGREISAAANSDRLWLRRRAQMFFQDPVSSLSPRLSVRRLLEEPLTIHGLPRAEHWPRVERLLATMGVNSSLLDKYPHQLSGGQARRIGIARALALQPTFVVADEPTAGLDVSVQGDLLNLMADLQAEHGLTYLLISHNLTVIRRVTGRIAIMYLGQIVEDGPTKAIFDRPAHPYSQALISANPSLTGEKREKIVLKGDLPSPLDPPKGCRFHTRCPVALPDCATQVPEPRAVIGEPGRTVRCHYPLVEAESL